MSVYELQKAKPLQPEAAGQGVPPSNAPAIVLAAGASARLGAPKALVRLGSRTLIEWAHHHLMVAGCRPVVLVVNPDIEGTVRDLLPEADLVVNHTFSSGRTGSLQTGLHHLNTNGHSLARVVMAPVDRPGWNASVVRALVDGSGCVGAVHANQRGHPVVLDETGVQTVLQAEASAPLNALVEFSPVEVKAPWLGLNVDTPQQVEVLEGLVDELLLYFAEGEGI